MQNSFLSLMMRMVGTMVNIMVSKVDEKLINSMPGCTFYVKNNEIK